MRGLLGLVTVVFLLSAAVPDEAPAISRRKQCRLSCAAAIDACVAQGGRRRRCKRQTLKQCRQQGLPTCAVTTTTTSQGVTTTVVGATTTNPGGSTTTTTTLGGGTTTTAPSIHGCTLAGATDMRGTANPTVTFDNFFYMPNCIRIQPTQSVTFSGNFSFHPLVGGTVPTTDPQSPIETDNSQPIDFPTAGTFPFFCGNHGVSVAAMRGVVFVAP